jgi:predicted enzyme related to lactoylglutathione lyase
MDDAARAQKFYTETFGWALTDMPEMKYVLAKTETDPSKRSEKRAPIIGGGFMQRGGPLEAPSFSIMVMDMDASIEKIKAAGGKVVKEKTSFAGPEGPWMAYFKDTEGNLLSLWQPTAAEIAASNA